MKERKFPSIKLSILFLSLVTLSLISFNVSKEENAYSDVSGFKVGDYIQFESYNIPGHYLKIVNLNAKLRKVNLESIHTKPLWETVFIVEKGLANSTSGFYSFRAANKKDHYLRTVNNDVIIHPKSKETRNIEDATWKIDKGRADASLVSFRAFNFRGSFIRHINTDVIISPINKDLDRKDATWKIVVRNDLKQFNPVISDKDPASITPPPKPGTPTPDKKCVLSKEGDTKNSRSTTRDQLSERLTNEVINFCRGKGGIKNDNIFITDKYDGYGKHYLFWKFTVSCNCTN